MLMKKRFFYILLFLCFYCTQALATHYSGAELTWKCVQAGPNVKFQFRLKIYVKCRPLVVPTQQQLKLCNTVGTLSPILNYGEISNTTYSILVGGKINTALISRKSTVNTCSNPTVNPLSCESSDVGAMEELIYESAEIDFTGVSFQSNGSMPISVVWYGTGRSATINLNNAGDNHLVVVAKIYPYFKKGSTTPTSLSQCYDSAPDFAEPPVFIQQAQLKDIYINNSAMDADMDEVRYELADPLLSVDNFDCAIADPSSEIYKNFPSFNTLNPFGLASNLYGFNTLTSEFKVRPNAGTYNYTIKVSSYKGNQKVSEITRDFQTIFFINSVGTNNTPPVVIAPFTNVNGLPSYTKEVNAGDLVRIPIIVRDSTNHGTISTQSLELTIAGKAMGLNNADTSQGCTLPPCAKLTKSKNNAPYSTTNPLPILISNANNYNFGYGYQLPAAYGSLSNDTLWVYWKTSCSNLKFDPIENKVLPSTYDFIVSVKDDTCRMPSKTSRTISIVVNPPLNYLKTKLTCIRPNNNNHIEVNWETTGDTSKFIAYQLYRNNILIKVITNHAIRSYVDSSNLANLNSLYAIRLLSNCDAGLELSNEKVMVNPILSARQLANRNVKINWSFTDTTKMLGTAGFNVYRSITGSPYNWQLITDTDGDNFNTTALDTFKICGQTLYYLLVAVDKNNCVYMSNIDSIINLPLKVQITKQKNCLGANTKLKFNYIQGGIKPYRSIQWLGDDGLFANNSDTVIHVYNTLGLKRFTLTIIDSFGCRYDFVDSVLIKKAPIARVNIDKACPGSIINFQVILDNSENGDSVHFYGDNGLFVKAGPYFDPFYSSPKWIFLSNNGIGKFPVIIKVTKLNGCSITRVDTVYIDNPTVRILNDSITCCNTLTDTLRILPDQYLTKPWNTVTWFDDNTNKVILSNSEFLPVSLLVNYTNIRIKVRIEDAKGCKAEDVRNFNIGTGINNINSTYLYTYPNPVNDVLMYNTTDNLDRALISIYNTLGQKIAETSINNNYADVSTLAPGLYTFTLLQQGKLYRGKFVK